jgi:hypothetical protein
MIRGSNALRILASHSDPLVVVEVACIYGARTPLCCSSLSTTTSTMSDDDDDHASGIYTIQVDELRTPFLY